MISRRGDRLCNLGSMVTRNTSSKGNSFKSASSSKAKAYATPKSSSRGKSKDSNEPLAEPLVSEIIAQEFSFLGNYDV